MAALETHSQWRARAVENLGARWDIDPSITTYGEMTKILYHDDPMDVAVAARLKQRTQLGVSPGDVMLAAERTWGRSFRVNGSGGLPNVQATCRRSGDE